MKTIIGLSVETHPSSDCPEHDIINEIGQDMHSIELMDDSSLSSAFSNSFQEVGIENNDKRTSEIIADKHPWIREVLKST